MAQALPCCHIKLDPLAPEMEVITLVSPCPREVQLQPPPFFSPCFSSQGIQGRKKVVENWPYVLTPALPPLALGSYFNTACLPNAGYTEDTKVSSALQAPWEISWGNINVPENAALQSKKSLISSLGWRGRVQRSAHIDVCTKDDNSIFGHKTRQGICAVVEEEPARLGSALEKKGPE